MKDALLSIHRNVLAMELFNESEADRAEAKGYAQSAQVHRSAAVGNRQARHLVEAEMRAVGVEVPA